MQEINQSEFEQIVRENEFVVLDFYSTECPPCEALAPKFKYLSDLYGEKIKFVKIFRQQNKELASKLGISGSPTVLFFKNGNKIGNVLTGGIKTSELMKQLDALLDPELVGVIKDKIKPIHSNYDVAILGGGPAGLAAGIYLAQAKINTVIIDKQLTGGQVSTTHMISNYPGFSEPINGYMLAHHMSEQAKTAGVIFKAAVDITNVDLTKKEIIIDGYETINAKKILIAAGASPRSLHIPGEIEFKGRGISYCATCDAKYFQDKEVIVIGGGNTAIEESEFISKFAKKITIIHQFDELQANKIAQDKAFANPKISFLLSHEPRKFEKQNDKKFVTAENLKTNEVVKIESDGVFVFVGMKPNIDSISPMPILDDWGYIKVDTDMRTNLPDVFAAGDVASKKFRQITIAVAEGTVASLVIAKELS